MKDPIPPPGNVTIILTNQCSQYTYGPKDNTEATMHTLTDTFGNVYALQSSPTNATNAEEWQMIVDSAVFPPGWTVGTEVLTENEMHYSYVIGDDCWLVILKDSAGSAWQQYVYGEPLEQSTFLSSFDCPPLVGGSTNGTSPSMPSVPSMPPSPPSTSSSVPFGYDSVIGYITVLVLSMRIVFGRAH